MIQGSGLNLDYETELQNKWKSIQRDPIYDSIIHTGSEKNCSCCVTSDAAKFRRRYYADQFSHHSRKRERQKEK
jgi:hypothetical protein